MTWGPTQPLLSSEATFTQGGQTVTVLTKHSLTIPRIPIYYEDYIISHGETEAAEAK